MSEAASTTTLEQVYADVARLVHEHFPELALYEPIEIAIGRRSRRRLASVRRGISGPRITVNPLLLLPGVPRDVVEMTLAHELCHIVHGFGRSPHPKGLKPHRGGVVEAEMDRRGLRWRRMAADAWCRVQWDAWYAAHATDLASLRAARARQVEEAWTAFLSMPGMRTQADLQRLAHLAAARAHRPRLAGVRWLHATRRQKRMSYLALAERVVLVHGGLAHQAVPECVILHELAYWMGRGNHGGHKDARHVMHAVLTPDEIGRAEQWRRQWLRFLRRHTPV